MQCRYAFLASAALWVLGLGSQAHAQTASGQSATDQVAEVVVTAQGGSDQGYKVDTAPLGPLGVRSIQDTPFSIDAISSGFIQNIQASSAEDVFRVNPFVQLDWPSSRNGQIFVQSRGLSVDNKTVDDLRVPSFEIDPVEDKEQIDILRGPSGFLYGQADPGGTVNYVLKRPTPQRFMDLTAGDNGGGLGFAHADLGGPIDDAGRFGYRLNLFGEGGDTEIDHQSEKRYLVSAAADYHIAPKWLLQFDYEYNYTRTDGVPAGWNFVFAGVPNPKAPEADKLWSQDWVYSDGATSKGGGRLTGDITDWLSFRSAFTISSTREHFQTYNIPKADTAGQYNPFVATSGPNHFDNTAEYVFLDAKATTGPIRHKLTFGFTGNDTTQYGEPNQSQVCLSPAGVFGFANCSAAAASPFSLSAPLYVPSPADLYSETGGASYRQNYLAQRNIVIGDDIDLLPQLELLAGGTHTEITDKDYNPDGSTSSAYDKSAWSPTASLIYKPLTWVSAYFTYAEGLEEGTIVPQGFSNFGQVLAPIQDRQYELGAKATVSGVLLTAALYQLEKPNQFSNNAAPLPTYVSDGLQRDRGLELGATGKITPDLTVVAGATFMDNKVVDANDPLTVGKWPVATSNTIAKAYLEYRLPWITGLFVSGGVNYTGKFATDAHNDQFLPSATTVDLGARYERVILDHPTVFRVYATNLGNDSYWISQTFTGDPRKVAFSVSSRF